jgi:acetylornithine deacetylase
MVDPLPLLRELVSIDSVNPGLVHGAAGEAQAAEACRLAMERAGMDVVVQPVLPGRPNVIGVLEGRSPGPSLMLCGHLDTVGVQGMADPFVARVSGGRVFGRGAQDMKGGIAAMISAAAVLSRSWTRGRLLVAVVVDEEHQSAGAEALVREWRADAAIVTEPTDLAMAIAHKGFAWFEIVTRGHAAHGSRPAEGRDAILRMGRVLGALERLDRELQARPPAPLEGTGSLHASIISGGRELSSYPDLCALRMERRIVSGETATRALQEIQMLLDRLLNEDPEFEAGVRLMGSRPPYRLNAGHPLVEAVGASLAQAGRSSAPVGMTFWTDAAILGEAGIPTVLFGPGGGGLHGLVEYVNLEDLYVCRDVLIDTAGRFGGEDRFNRQPEL